MAAATTAAPSRTTTTSSKPSAAHNVDQLKMNVEGKFSKELVVQIFIGNAAKCCQVRRTRCQLPDHICKRELVRRLVKQ